MAAQQNERGARLKFSAAVTAFPFEFGCHIAFGHRLGQAFTAAERSSLFHIVNIQFAFGFRLIIAVVKFELLGRSIVLIELDDFEIFPFRRDFLPLRFGTVIGAQTHLIVFGNPVQSAEIGCGSNFLHKGFRAGGYHALRQVARNFEVEFHLICQTVEIVLNRQIFTEVQELFQFVAVGIELAVEVLGDEPVGVEQFFGTCKTERAQKQAFKFIVGNSVFLTGTDVEEVIPEICAEVAFCVLVNQVCKQSAGVLHRAPFQHAVNRHMEHNRVHIL